MEHKDDITAFALSPDKRHAATGNIGPKPLIAIWDVTTMECKVRITGPLTKGIKTLAFSNDGKYLAASAMDDEHMVAVWEWASNKTPDKAIAPIAHGKGSKAKILGMGFTADGNQVIGVAIKEVNFYTFKDGKIKGKKASFGKNTICAVPVCCTIDNSVFAGTFQGNLYHFNGPSIKESIKAHEGVVNAMAPRENGKGMLSGGKDGKIIIWKYASGKLQQESTIMVNVPNQIKSMCPEINALCHSPQGNVLVGTRGGEVMEFFPGDAKPKIHLRSHCKDELWGLAVNPKNSKEFITVG